MVSQAPDSFVNVAHVSLKYEDAALIDGNNGTNDNESAHLLTAYQFPNPTTVDVITTITSFGRTIFRCGLRHESSYDDESAMHVVVPDNSAVDMFLNDYFLGSITDLGNMDKRAQAHYQSGQMTLQNFVLKNLFVAQTLIEMKTGGDAGVVVGGVCSNGMPVFHHPLLELVVGFGLDKSRNSNSKNPSSNYPPNSNSSISSSENAS